MDIEIILNENGILEERVFFKAYQPILLEYEVQKGLVLMSSSLECGGEVKITCDVTDNVTLFFSGDGKALGYIGKTERGEKFSFRIKPPERTRLSITLKLPPNANVVEVNEIKQVFPNPTSTGTDLSSITLFWNNAEIIFVEYAIPQKSDIIPYVLIVLGIGIVIGALLGLRFKKEKKQETIMKFLRENELAVVDIIKKHGGEIQQKDLEKQLDWSGPKLSKVIRRLEEDNVVKRIPKGRKNIVKLLI